MMSKIRPGQTVFDVAIIETGDPLKGFENAIKAGLNPALDLSGINIDFMPVNNTITQYFKKNSYQPATARSR